MTLVIAHNMSAGAGSMFGEYWYGTLSSQRRLGRQVKIWKKGLWRTLWGPALMSAVKSGERHDVREIASSHVKTIHVCLPSMRSFTFPLLFCRRFRNEMRKSNCFVMDFGGTATHGYHKLRHQTPSLLIWIRDKENMGLFYCTLIKVHSNNRKRQIIFLSKRLFHVLLNSIMFCFWMWWSAVAVNPQRKWTLFLPWNTWIMNNFLPSDWAHSQPILCIRHSYLMFVGITNEYDWDI